jgi:hypothetical protein
MACLCLLFDSSYFPGLMSCVDLHVVPCSFIHWFATYFENICCVFSLVSVVQTLCQRSALFSRVPTISRAMKPFVARRVGRDRVLLMTMTVVRE